MEVTKTNTNMKWYIVKTAYNREKLEGLQYTNGNLYREV